MNWLRFILLTFVLIGVPHAQARDDGTITIGSKNFTEQVILGELVAQLIERSTELQVQRQFGLGGTDICQSALVAEQIDIYVEYTGTGLLNVLKRGVINNRTEAFRVVARNYRDRYDLEWLPPIGFNNTYAITVRRDTATSEGWSVISDLVPSAQALRAGFTAEFMERPDGYPGLRHAYGVQFGRTIDLNPGLMYEAVADEQVDVICAFATDGRISEFGLQTLKDDRSFFPPYDAAPVIRGETVRAHPELREALAPLAGTITNEGMRRMNHAVDVLKRKPSDVARAWIFEHVGRRAHDDIANETGHRSRGFFGLLLERRNEVGKKSVEHLVLTILGTLIAVIIGVPLGVLVQRCTSLRGPVMAFTEIVQTIPSLAMLAFLFAVYGLLGKAPAVTALVLYALLPIVLNTFTGLREVPRQIVEAADGVGMSSWQRLWMVELPLAAPVIIAGIRAATVLTVGIATLSTYIGAGGLGDFIERGLSRNDTRLTLLGAAPAALMAVCFSLLIRYFERLTKRG